MSNNSAERSQRARIAALAKAAQAPSGTALTAAAREAAWNRFYEATDPDLPEKERRRQADAARRLHFVRMAQKSAAARRRARQAAEALISAADQVDTLTAEALADIRAEAR